MKLSELPVGTIIKWKDEDYIKRDWSDIYSGSTRFAWDPIHCEDCCGGFPIMNDDADLMITGYQIVSVPFGVVWAMALALAEEYDMVDENGEEKTIMSLIEEAMNQHMDAVKMMADAEKRDIWKPLYSFNDRDGVFIEINEFGEVRVEETIFKPVFDDVVGRYITTFVDQLGEEHPIDAVNFVKVHFDKGYI